MAPIGPDPLANLVEPGATVTLSDETTDHALGARRHETEPIRVGRADSARARDHASCATRPRTSCPRSTSCSRPWSTPPATQWLHIRIPMKPNGRTGWVPRRLAQPALRRAHAADDLAAQQARRRCARTAASIWQAPVGVGKAGTPTPKGNFWIRELLRGGGGAYGPWAFGTSAYSNIREWRGAPVVGIHGTNQPQPHPRRPVARLRPRAQQQDQPARAGSCRSARRSRSPEPRRRRRWRAIGSTLPRSGAPRAPSDGCAIPCDVTAAYLTVNQGVVVRIHPGE